MATEKIYQSIKNVVNKIDESWLCENPENFRSKEFNKVYRNAVKKLMGSEYEVKASGGYCECSGFIKHKASGKLVYFNSGDYRMSAPYNDIFTHVLVRIAEHDKDYRGGPNNFTELKDIKTKVEELMGE